LQEQLAATTRHADEQLLAATTELDKCRAEIREAREKELARERRRRYKQRQKELQRETLQQEVQVAATANLDFAQMNHPQQQQQQQQQHCFVGYEYET